jgi:FMN phosphatase YigB (HAD superfamily)
MKNKIKNLLFDLGNVIIDIDIAGAQERLKSMLRKDADMAMIQKALVDYECGQISTEIFINHILRQSERKYQAVDVIEAWNGMLIGIPHYRLTMLEMLRPNYNVYLLSNTNALHLEWVHRYVKRAHKVSDFEESFFDQAFYSHLIGDRKPNPSIYKYVSEEVFMTPEHTLFLDDMEENISAAADFGFHTYHVKPGEEVAEYLKLEGFY